MVNFKNSLLLFAAVWSIHWTIALAIGGKAGQWAAYNAAYTFTVSGALMLCVLFGVLFWLKRGTFTLGLAYTFFGSFFVSGFWMIDRLFLKPHGSRLSDYSLELIFVGTSAQIVGIVCHFLDAAELSKGATRAILFSAPAACIVTGAMIEIAARIF
jgi:hypothetical protein